MYENGLGGLARNEQETVRLIKLAADQGDPDAQYRLGVFYALGLHGLPKDEQEMVRLYQLAADQGHADALYRLGGIYEKGRAGVVKNEEKAAQLYGLAAERGLVEAQLLLGSRYLYPEAAYRKAIRKPFGGFGRRPTRATQRRNSSWALCTPTVTQRKRTRMKLCDCGVWPLNMGRRKRNPRWMRLRPENRPLPTSAKIGHQELTTGEIVAGLVVLGVVAAVLSGGSSSATNRQSAPTPPEKSCGIRAMQQWRMGRSTICAEDDPPEENRRDHA